MRMKTMPVFNDRSPAPLSGGLGSRRPSGSNSSSDPCSSALIRGRIRSVAALALCLLAVVAGGCQTARVERPLTGEFGGNDPESQLEFWHRLAEQPVTSNDDAFHGLLLFLGGEDPATDYAGRVQALKSRGLLPQNFNQPAEQAVDRGTLAVAIARTLDIRGGWAMRLFGPTPRYATRELVYLDLYPPSSPNQTFSGTEYLGIIGKMEDFQRERPGGAAAPADGDEAPRAPDFDVGGGGSPAVEPDPNPGSAVAPKQ